MGGNSRHTLHKWHSNVKELESISNETAKGDQDSNRKAYSQSTAKILGFLWEKKADVARVNLEACQLTVSPSTKRKILAAINGVYDLPGWVSPVMIDRHEFYPRKGT
jgi:peroxiredoxin family protein